MDSNLEKSFDRSRSYLFGLLQSCLFEWHASEICPLAHLRNNLSLEEKYHYAMELSDRAVKELLKKHKDCFSKMITIQYKSKIRVEIAG